MTPSHAMYSAALLTLVGISTGLAVDRAASQELTMRNELIAEPSSTPAGSGARLGNPVQNSTMAPATKLPAGKLWPPQAIERPNPLWAIPMASLTATRERPIFSPSRRPPPAAAPQQSIRGNEPNRPLLALVGTVAAPEGIAIFQDEESKNIVRLRTGESYSGWTLTAVKAREVTLLRGPETAVLVIPSPPAK
jgi:general secretion pathway protein N